MKLTDEATYEMVHSNLNALELTEDFEPVATMAAGKNSLRRTGHQNQTKSTMAQTHD